MKNRLNDGKEKFMLNQYFFALLLSFVSISSFAQTCQNYIPESTPDSRFTDQNNGTILDTYTNLVWKKCVEGMIWYSPTNDCIGTAANQTWYDALELAVTANSNAYANQTDWRLPDFKELFSIVETSCYDPAINETFFPSTPTEKFWTSTHDASDEEYAHLIDFTDTYSDLDSKDYAGDYYTRLVRN